MTLSGLGDLAQSYSMRGYNLSVRRELDSLVTELSTGQSSDIPDKLGGEYGAFTAVESGLSSLSAYATVLIEAENFAAGMQTALDAIQVTMADTGPKLLAATNPGDEQALTASLAEAAHRFEAIVGQINGRDGDRSLFAGDAVDRPAIATAESLLTDLSAAVSGLTTASDIRTAVDAWFDTPGGGFETTGYLGSADPLDPFKLSDVSDVRLQLRAQDAEMRDVLKEFSIAALMSDGLLSADASQRMELAEDVGLSMINAERELTLARAEIGTAEAQIEETSVRNAAERTSLLEARDNLIGIDPFETATRLEEVQNQLQILYSVTARMAGMSLAEYLR